MSDANKSQQLVSANAVTEEQSSRKTMLPAGFRFEALGSLAQVSDHVRSVVTFNSDTAAEVDLNAWFVQVDKILRNADCNSELSMLARSIGELIESPDWDAFLAAIILDAKKISETRLKKGQPRSLWGTTPIISLGPCVKADRIVGIDAESLVFTTYYVTNDFDINLTSQVEAVRNAGFEFAFYWLVLIWALISYDIFFYFNDRGILLPEESTGRFNMGIRQQELSILKHAEKLIYTIPYGADYRTREKTMSRSRFNFCMDCPTIGGFCFCNADAWGVVFHTIGAYATAMLSSGLAIHQMPGSRRLEHIVIEADHIVPHFPSAVSGRKLRLLHVPNHPHFKGTRYLEAALERFGSTSPIEYISATGVSNERVRELMSEADIVVDQLIGGYFGMTALEAMAYGKPVICYIVDPQLVLAPDECPIINADPDTIFDVLKDVVEKRGTLEEIGRRSRSYIETHYSVAALADRLKALYRESANLNCLPGAINTSAD